MTKKLLISALLLCVSIFAFGQLKYGSRTAHINVKSSNKFMDVEADNYQVASTLDPATGYVNFLGLLKSFEFKLGAIDQVYNSKMVSSLAKPKFKYVGKITNIKSVNFDRPGTYPIQVKGDLFIWDMKRVTPGTGTLIVKNDGSVEVASDISFRIEEASVNKANALMRKYLPAGVNVDTDRLGIDRKVSTQLKVTYRKKRATTRSTGK
ncbi:MAG: hypothetical protein AAGJ18_15380 [Bacteroidota bacterium]